MHRLATHTAPPLVSQSLPRLPMEARRACFIPHKNWQKVVQINLKIFWFLEVDLRERREEEDRKEKLYVVGQVVA